MSEAFRLIVNEAMRLERERFIGAAAPSALALAACAGQRLQAQDAGDAPRARHPRRPPGPPARRRRALLPEGPGARGALERALKARRRRDVRAGRLDPQGLPDRPGALRPRGQLHRRLAGRGPPGRRAGGLEDPPLGCYEHVLLDARYEKVRHGGSVLSCAVLIAVGIGPDGRRSILGASVALSEAEVHWRAFLESLQARGLHGVKLAVSDDHAGLRAALKARLPVGPLAALPVPPAAERSGLRAAPGPARGGPDAPSGRSSWLPTASRPSSSWPGPWPATPRPPPTWRAGWRRTSPRGSPSSRSPPASAACCAPPTSSRP